MSDRLRVIQCLREAFIPALVASLVFVLIMLAIGPGHNSDADLYYQSTIRLLNNQNWVNGLISPLLSLLMYPLSYFGITLPRAYQIVNAIAGITLFASAGVLSVRLGLQKIEIYGVLILILLLMLPFAAYSVTSDFLATSFASCAFVLLLSYENDSKSHRLLIWTGVLIGLASLSKIIEFFVLNASIFIVSLYYFKDKKSSVRAISLFGIPLLVSTLMIAPWLLVLKLKYGVFNFGIQPFVDAYVASGYVATIDSQLFSPVMHQASDDAVTSLGVLTNLIWQIGHIVIRVPEQVYTGLFSLLGDVMYLFNWASISLLLIVVTAIWPNSRGSFRHLATINILSHVTIYMLIWGGRMRYYYPIIPLIIIMFFLNSDIYRNKLRLYGAVIFIGIPICVCAFQFAFHLSGQVDRKLVHELMIDTSLHSKNGSITGKMNDPNFGLVAALNRREVSASLDFASVSGQESLSQFIKEVKPEMIIWTGRPPQVLAQSKEVVEISVVHGDRLDAHVYNIKY